jgi:hypothetical protein
VLNTLRSEKKTVVSNKLNGTIGMEFYYEGVTVQDSAIPKADSFQAYYDTLVGNKKPVLKSFNDVPHICQYRKHGYR